MLSRSRLFPGFDTVCAGCAMQLAPIDLFVNDVHLTDFVEDCRSHLSNEPRLSQFFLRDRKHERNRINLRRCIKLQRFYEQMKTSEKT